MAPGPLNQAKPGVVGFRSCHVRGLSLNEWLLATARFASEIAGVDQESNGLGHPGGLSGGVQAGVGPAPPASKNRRPRATKTNRLKRCGRCGSLALKPRLTQWPNNVLERSLAIVASQPGL